MSNGNPPPKPGPRNLALELGEHEGQGIYANLALITHSHSEFILDFARALPGLPKAKVYARILMTPYHAKALHKALGDNLAKYEEQFGTIQLRPDEQTPKSIGF
jgi:hypothetical protein